MKHVAEAAGVSVMTVSLALRQDPSIPATTRDRVIAIAEKLGYRRNPLVSVLMAGLRGWHPRGRDGHVIAFVNGYPAHAITRQQSQSLARFHAGAEEGAAKHGYRLQVFRLGEGELSEARLEQVLIARNIRGVVFAPFPTVGSALRQSWKHHALAAVGFTLAHPPLHRAVNHQNHSIRLAFSELLALGYRRIGVVMSRHESGRAEHAWLSSVLLVQYEHAGTDRTFPLLYEEKIERPALRAWIRQHRIETIIVTTEENIPAMLPRRGGRGMRRVGFAHLHLTPALAGCSGIDQNNERVGAAAVDLVVEQLHKNSFGFPDNPKTVLIEGRWVPGTTAPGVGGKAELRSRRPRAS